jgi:hypothetical protein
MGGILVGDAGWVAEGRPSGCVAVRGEHRLGSSSRHHNHHEHHASVAHALGADQHHAAAGDDHADADRGDRDCSDHGSDDGRDGNLGALDC